MIEQIIFSQLLTNDAYARTVIPHLKEDYFSDQSEKNFLKLYSHFYTKHNKIPSKTALLLEIENLKSSADVYTSMKDILDKTIEFDESLPYLVDATEKFCKERAVFNALRESVLIVDGQSKTKTSDAIPAILQAALAVCFDTSIGHNYFDESSDRYDYYHQTESRIPTGIPEFDKITKGGFPRKTLNLFLAPPHGGKSLVMSNVGVGAVLAGFNVLTITLEMSDMEFSKRYDVQLMDVDFDTLALLPKTTFESKFNKIAQKSRGQMIVKEFPTGAAHAGHFRSMIEELKIKKNFVPDLIIIDYLGICASENYKASSNVNSYTLMKAAGEELRALAITQNCAVVSAIQTNRSGIGSSELDMNNIAESLGSAMTADFITAIITTDELKDLSQMMFSQIKNRYGGIIDTAKFLLGVDYSKMKLFSLDDGAKVPTFNKDKALNNKKSVDSSAPYGFDILHTIKPVSGAFDNFTF